MIVHFELMYFGLLIKFVLLHYSKSQIYMNLPVVCEYVVLCTHIGEKRGVVVNIRQFEYDLCGRS